MAVSSIKEKLGKLLVNIGIKQLEIWSRKELVRIKNSSKPFCIEYSDKHYSIGDFDIKILSDNTAKVYKDSRFLHHFANKQIAIYYCAYEKLNKFASSSDLLRVDSELALAKSDYHILYNKLKNKKFSSNFDRDVKLAKFQQSYDRLKRAELQFKKTVTVHKYNKIWDTIL